MFYGTYFSAVLLMAYYAIFIAGFVFTVFIAENLRVSLYSVSLASPRDTWKEFHIATNNNTPEHCP